MLKVVQVVLRGQRVISPDGATQGVGRLYLWIGRQYALESLLALGVAGSRGGGDGRAVIGNAPGQNHGSLRRAEARVVLNRHFNRGFIRFRAARRQMNSR